MNLTELHPEYLSALAQQFGFLGAFLGGVSATIFVTLLTLAKPSSIVRWAIGLAALGAVSFIITAYMSVGVIANSHPNAPPEMAGGSLVAVQVIMSLSFMIGSLALLAAIGVSGWSRSKPLGIITSVVAALGAVPLILDFA
ncbi:MAG: hypothetical protein AAGL10_01400 [Pseudomonadota bacterium]